MFNFMSTIFEKRILNVEFVQQESILKFNQGLLLDCLTCTSIGLGIDIAYGRTRKQVNYLFHRTYILWKAIGMLLECYYILIDIYYLYQLSVVNCQIVCSPWSKIDCFLLFLRVSSVGAI